MSGDQLRLPTFPATVAASLLGIAWFIAVFPMAAGAQEKKFRWKPTAGSSWRYRFQQQVATDTTGTGKAVTVKLNTTMEVTWKVASVSAAGDAQIAQSIDRLAVTLETDKLDPVRYDSASKSTATGPAREIADRVGKLIGASCQFQLSPRGEVSELQPSAEWKQAFAGQPPSAGLEMMTPAGFTQVLNLVAVVWPEQSVAEGTGWEAVRESAILGGTLQQKTQYKFLGTKPVAGANLDQFEMAGTLGWSRTEQPAAPAEARNSDTVGSQARRGSPPAKIVEGTQAGSVAFNSELGRVVQGELTQKLVTERPYRELTIRVQSSSTLTVGEIR